MHSVGSKVQIVCKNYPKLSQYSLSVLPIITSMLIFLYISGVLVINH